MINIIAAVDNNGAIGYNNDLIYRCKEDMRDFVLRTTNHVVMMGRKTWESLPKHPLPNRVNYVITSKVKPTTFVVDTGDTISYQSDLKEAIIHAEFYYPEKEIFIIGGGQLYNEAIDFVDRVYLTMFDTATTKYDTTFPMDKLDGNFDLKAKLSLPLNVTKPDSVIEGCDVRFLTYDRTPKIT